MDKIKTAVVNIPIVAIAVPNNPPINSPYLLVIPELWPR